MLCVKDDTFEKKYSTSEYVIFTNKDNSKYSCVYFDIFGEKYEEFLQKIKTLDGLKMLYIFTLGDYIDNSDFSDMISVFSPAILLNLCKKIAL